LETILFYQDFKPNDYGGEKGLTVPIHDLMPRTGHSTGMQGKCSAFPVNRKIQVL